MMQLKQGKTNRHQVCIQAKLQRFFSRFICVLSLMLFTPLGFSLSSSYSFVGQPFSTIYTAKEHGGHNQNWTSIQSNDGIIYVGHTQGISQWDGEYWRSLPTPQLTPVRSISQFNDALYFGTTDDIFRLVIDSAGEMLVKSLLENDVLGRHSFGDVWSSAANSAGVLFVSTEHTFFYDGERLHVLDQVLSSKHAVFTIDDAFYYKVRDLPHLYKLSVEKQQGQLSVMQTQLPFTLPEDARVMEIMRSVDGRLTIFTEQHGVFQLIKEEIKQVIAPESFEKDVQLYDAILSSDGFYYVSSTYSGLFILDQQLNIVRHYQENDGISMNTVFSVNEDLQGNIWLTGIPNVVKMRPPHVISQFKAGNTSTEILRLKNTDMGIFASGNGLFKLTPSAMPNKTPAFLPMSNNINSSVDLIAFKGSLIRSGYNGIFELELNQDTSAVIAEHQLIETALGRIVQYNPRTSDLLISATDGAFILGKSGEGFQYQSFPEEIDQLISLYLDKHDRLWLGSATSQLFQLDNVSTQGISAPINSFGQSDGLGLGPVDIFNIDGEAIFSSAGQLFRFVDGRIKEADLPMISEQWLNTSQIVDQLIQTPTTKDSPERIWYRKNGRSGYFEKSATNQWMEYTDIFESLPEGGFNNLFIAENDILWFVRDKAEIYRVDIAKARQLPPIAPLNIRRMESNNDLISFTVAQGSRIELLPEQKNIRFSYASTDSSSPSPIEYRTRLADGNEVPWSSWSQETYRDFTQLVPKHYRLQVQAKDAWDRTTETYLDIAVIAPWYLSNIAYLIYTISAFILIFAFAWLVQKWRTLSLEAANKALEQKVEQRTKEVNEKVEQLRQQQILKDRFFGNVSHEFRTPLTLTIGPLETLLVEHKAELSHAVAHLAQMALNNASKMLALVGQVLDLNRLEAGKLPLRIAQYDISELLRNIADRFRTWANQNEQSIQTLDCDEPFLLWFDIDQLDKCVSNLLSNAIKYSGKGSIISLKLRCHGEYAHIIVQDNGIGISEVAKPKVFERFYQDKSSENVAAPGTGIGLALVKELMELHHGDARLEDSEEAGCCFVLSLNTGNHHFSTEQIIEPIEVSNFAAIETTNEYATGEGENTLEQLDSIEKQEDVTTLLIVDDNQELLNFISLRLSASFKILQAINGQDGYEKACKNLPDLIISDVNMPVMTGLELATSIKKNSQTKTIPIILLTAKATKREVVAGFSVGADDYLTKPFDTSELIMRVHAQINSRKLVRESQRDIDLNMSGTNKVVSFTDKLNAIINKQLSEPEFNVEKLASLLHMSRDTLIRRCKKECSDTPLNILVQQRMLRADKLLNENAMSISEVAYACGFESLAYFSKSYKKHRGVSPSEVFRT